MVFGISVNTSKANYESIVDRIKDVIYDKFQNSLIKVFLDGEGLYEERENLSFLFVVGGDGTILRNVHLLCDYDLPIIGVNYGTLGFMASVEIRDIEKAIDQIKNNNYYIDKRLMIEARSEDENSDNSFYALNDVVITKIPLSRLLKFKIYIDDKYYNTFSGDGIIISTPTGSTAYSLSSGGPIVFPDMESIIITPICPHSLNAKSLVISSHRHIRLEIDGIGESDIYTIIDGQDIHVKLSRGIIHIYKHNRYCSLVRFDFYDYYHVLREKLINRI